MTNGGHGKRRALVFAATMSLAVGLLGASASGGERTTVRVANFIYSPKTVRIDESEKVVWKNQSGRHTVTFKRLNFDKRISGDKRVSRTFRRQGRFRYFCRFHRSLGMKGKVVVR